MKSSKTYRYRSKSGEIVGLLGPNGAGKTTCFYMIVGLIRADHGKVVIDKKEITQLPMHGRARCGIGYLPQEASIFRKLSVRDNILAILETRQDMDKQQREKKMFELLEEFHITHIIDSLGMSLVRWRASTRRNCTCFGNRTLLHSAG